MIYNPLVYVAVGFLFGLTVSVGLYIQNKIIQQRQELAIKAMQIRLINAMERYGWRKDENTKEQSK